MEMNEPFLDNNFINFNLNNFADFTPSFNTKLTCLYFNARSIRNKWDTILSSLENLKIRCNIIVITETWLYQNEIEFFQIPGYNSFFNSRDSRQGGGTAIFIQNDFNASLKLSAKDFNTQIIEIECPSKEKYNIYCIYRPEGNLENFLNLMEENLNIITPKKIYRSWRFQS